MVRKVMKETRAVPVTKLPKERDLRRGNAGEVQLTPGKGARRGMARRGDGATDANVPTTKEFGNTKGDREWLKAQVEAGLIEDIDEDNEDVAFGALKLWKGDPSSVGSSWTLPDRKRQCNGKAKIRDNEGRPVVGTDGNALMRPCGNWAILGGRVCVIHGGGTDKVREKAKLRLVAAADTLIGHLIAIALDPNTPPKDRISAINSALDRAGVKGGIEVTVENPGYVDILKTQFGDWDAE